MRNTVDCCTFFSRMRMDSKFPDSKILINLLVASVHLKSLKFGRVLHSFAITNNLLDSIPLRTAVLGMYSKLGSLENAYLLFEEMPERDCAAWNTMIQACSHNRKSLQSLKLLTQMVRSGMKTDMFTAIAASSSVGELKSLKWGRELHGHVIRSGSDSQVSVCNSVISMYDSCHNLNSARNTFNLVERKTVITWSAIIKAHVKHEQPSHALNLFVEMKLNGCNADFITMINILPACVIVGAHELVMYLQGYSIKLNLIGEPSVNTAFLVAYAKCGCIEMARKVFEEEEIDDKDLIMWNSMISAYSQHGEYIQSFELYDRMKKNLKPDEVTFLALLTACVNSGCVEEAWRFFREMTERYNYQPWQEHYACMVNVLGRRMCIDEAMKMMESIPLKADARVWGPLLNACKMQSEAGVAEVAVEKLAAMEPKNAGNYILLSNIYASAGRWEDVAKTRRCLKQKGLKKMPGYSWLEINGKVHAFHAAETSHPEAVGIYTVLEQVELESKHDDDFRFENVYMEN